MWQFLFFIIFILLIQGLFKLLEKEEELEERPTTEEKLKKYFEALGLPIEVPTSKKEKILKKKEEIEDSILYSRPLDFFGLCDYRRD